MTRSLPRACEAGKKTVKLGFAGISALIFASTPLRAANATASQEQAVPVLQQSAATATALARAARDLPDSERQRTTQAALSIILLTKFDRILPRLQPTTLNQLADIFLAENPDAAEQAAVASKFPPADTINFDGSRLTGGNFRNIDAIIGLGGRPIALDRELPAWIVPLEPARTQALDSSRNAGWSSQKFAELQSLFNRIYAADVGEHLVADGIFLRPYAGRMDDLYHHLVQQGGRNGQLDYFALLDSLPVRQYSPIAGTASRKSVPPLRVNLSNILSGGSLQAIQNFKAENPRDNVQNPFKGFAVRTLPYLPDQLRKTAPGSDLKLSGDLMQRAISDPRRFSPGKAPPLFHDPSRFLGQWEDPRFIRVSKKKKASNAALFAEIQKVDFDTPLPEMSFEPAGNALLSSAPKTSAPDDTVDLLNDLGLPPEAENTAQYDPPDAPEPVLPPARITEPQIPPAPTPLLTKPAPPLLDSEPLETPPVIDLAQAPTPEPPKPEPAATPVARAIPVNPPEESRGPASSSYQVAVLTPTANEAIDYLKKIAASDISLSNNLAATRRADCVIRWLGEAVKPFEPLLTQSPESQEAKAVEPLIVQARDEVVALLKDREALQSSFMQELKDRQNARQALEKEIQTARRDELTRRSGTGA
ncbi:MAG: hypothetical protein NTZ08_08395 [Verrucomicrobia bacterium]|nr:hypothetical protein [Verrucomicrobiota bacterium]